MPVFEGVGKTIGDEYCIQLVPTSLKYTGFILTDWRIKILFFQKLDFGRPWAESFEKFLVNVDVLCELLEKRKLDFAIFVFVSQIEFVQIGVNYS